MEFQPLMPKSLELFLFSFSLTLLIQSLIISQWRHLQNIPESNCFSPTPLLPSLSEQPHLTDLNSFLSGLSPSIIFPPDSLISIAARVILSKTRQFMSFLSFKHSYLGQKLLLRVKAKLLIGLYGSIFLISPATTSLLPILLQLHSLSFCPLNKHASCLQSMLPTQGPTLTPLPFFRTLTKCQGLSEGS